MIYYFIFFIVLLILKLCIVVLTSSVLVNLSKCLVNAETIRTALAKRFQFDVMDTKMNKRTMNNKDNTMDSFDAKDHLQYIIQLNNKLKFSKSRHENYYSL